MINPKWANAKKTMICTDDGMSIPGRLSDQLDMQYHDSVNGTTTWLDHVKSVKDANPKE